MTPDMVRYIEVELRVSQLKPRGRGGFAEVYEGAKDEVLQAFKISLDPLSDKLRNMAEQELELMKHKAVRGCQQIVQLLGVHWKHGHLVTRWQLGEQSVADRLQECEEEGRAGLPPNEVRRYLLDAAKAIDLVNDLGFRHRDIKPDNLVVFRDEVGERVVRVADFGLALFVGASTMSKTGAGTLGYAAPDAEIGQRGTVTRTVDIYALAATAIKLATGHGPFGETQFKIVQAQFASRPDTTGLSPSQAAAVEAALCFDPAQRPFKTAKDFVAAFLDENVVGGPSRPSSPEAPAKEHRRQSKSWWSKLWLPSKPQVPAKEHKSAVESEIPRFQAGTQPQPTTVKALRQKAVGTRAIVIDLCRIGCVATIDDIPLLREYGRTLMEKNPERFHVGRAGQHSEEGKLVTLVVLAANVTPKNLAELIAAAKAKEGRSTSEYAQSYRTADQIEAQRAQFAPVPTTQPKRTRTEQARLIVTELRRSLDQPNYNVKEIQRRYDSAMSLCSGKCLEYLKRSENWFQEGDLGGAKRALTNTLRMFLGGD